MNSKIHTTTHTLNQNIDPWKRKKKISYNCTEKSQQFVLDKKVHNRAMGCKRKEKKDSCCFFCLLQKMMSTTKVKTCDA